MGARSAAALVASLLLVAVAGGHGDRPAPALTALFRADGNAKHPAFGCFRSPTLLRAGSSVLAIAAHHWDSKASACSDVGLKAIVVRSTRDGQTWSTPRTILNDTAPSRFPGEDGISMGTALWDPSTKTVFLFYATCSHVPGRAAPAPAHCPHAKLVVTSADEGQTWSVPRNLTAELAAMPGIWAPGPATGISLPTGRLLACGSYRPFPKYSAAPPIRSISQCIASDDHGASWRKVGAANYSGVQGTASDLQPNEVQPALFANGSILLNMRNVGKGHGYRLLSVSTDNGESFAAPWNEKQLYDYPSTEGSMVRHGHGDGSCLYVSNLGEARLDRNTNDPCEPPPQPSPCSSRHNLTLHASCDEAKTWQMLMSIYPGPAAYSSLSELPWNKARVGVLFESGPAAAANGTDKVLAPYHQLTYAELPVAGRYTYVPRRFYVSTTGDDTSAGTASDPFATIQRGVDHAGPGDTVVVRDGVYGCEPGNKPGQCSAVRSPLAGFPVVLSTQGTAAAPITLMAEHAGKAVLDCNQKCHSFILLQATTAHWVIDGFEIRNTYSSGIWGNDDRGASAHHYTIRRCHIHSIGNHVQNTASGITGFYSGPLSHNITFTDNVWGPSIGRTSFGPGCPGPTCFHDPCKLPCWSFNL